MLLVIGLIFKMAKGYYTPLHPEKYLGDPRKIRYLSSWELNFQRFCDNNPNVLAWASEEIRIKYYHPFKRKVCEYIPDFLIKYKDDNGNILTELIEIKPKKETRLTKKSTTYDKVNIAINQQKWTAAISFCNQAGIKFKVLTEDNLFIGAIKTHNKNPLTEGKQNGRVKFVR
jgi:hypothetical protein